MILDDILLSRTDFFAFNLKCLYYAGLWPQYWPKKRLYYRIFEMLMYIIPLVLIVMTGIGTYENKDDIIVLMANLDKNLVVYNFFLKAAFFVLKRRQLDILISEIKHSGDVVSKDTQRLMAIHVIVVTVLASATVGAFSLVSVSKGELPVDAWVPFDETKNLMKYLLDVQILAFAFMVTLLRNFAIQGVVCSIIMYMCEQLIQVQDTLKSIQFCRETETVVRLQFKTVIKKHVRLMRYSKTFTNIFQEFFLIQNLALTIELCLNAVMVSVVGLTNKTLLASFLSYLCIALLNGYIFCYLGNEIILKSGGVALAAYESEWTSWPIDMQKDLLIIIMVAQKPLSLSAGGMATMCIQTYSQAIYNAYSIFAMLNEFVE